MYMPISLSLMTWTYDPVPIPVLAGSVAGITSPGRSGLELTGSDALPSFLGKGGGRSRLSSIPDEAGDDEFEDSPRLSGDVANWGARKFGGSDDSKMDGEGGACRGMGTVGVSA